MARESIVKLPSGGTAAKSPYLTRGQLEEQSMVALDALEAADSRAPELLAPIFEHVRMHGEREGHEDYEGRAGDVAAGQQVPEWAWPFENADDAYLNAIGVYGITSDIGIPERLWEHVAEAWLKSFKRGYIAAREAGTRLRKKKSATQLDREITEALGARRRRRARHLLR